MVRRGLPSLLFGMDCAEEVAILKREIGPCEAVFLLLTLASHASIWAAIPMAG